MHRTRNLLHDGACALAHAHPIIAGLQARRRRKLHRSWLAWWNTWTADADAPMSESVARMKL